ncbi:MAG: hypothetical protein ABIT04_10365 [Novosphingobium sp.]
MSELAFQFAHVEQALAAMHGVADDRRSAFQARLKHYQKKGFPPGLNTGRGRAATYHVEHALKLGLALEFNQMGLTPERAIHLIGQNEETIRLALLDAVQTNLAEDAWPVFLCFDPVSLRDLQETEIPDDAVLTLEFITFGALRARFDNWTQSFFKREAIINLTSMAEELAHRLHVAKGINEGAVMEATLAALRHEERWHHGNR